ncbi:MAG TPA: cytochrome b/b6 domain-containing protein [Xanthobacteraceae bacterium]
MGPRRRTKKTKKIKETDYGTVNLYWLLAGSFAIAITTGLSIASEAPDRTWINILNLVLPKASVGTEHVPSAMLLMAIGVAYIVYVSRVGQGRRLRIDRARRPGYARWETINVVLYWLFFLVLPWQIVTGTLMYFGYARSMLVQMHWIGMWILLGYVVLLRVFRPAQVIATPRQFDVADMLDLLDEQGSQWLAREAAALTNRRRRGARFAASGSESIFHRLGLPADGFATVSRSSRGPIGTANAPNRRSPIGVNAIGNPGVVRTGVIADADVVEKVPEVGEVSGTVVDLVDVAPDVVEVCVDSPRRLAYLPGQSLSVKFRGFPARHYSPTVPLEWPAEPHLLRFHIGRRPEGRVSSALGRRINRGHRVKMTGPFGDAYFRRKHPGRLVLVSSGTGFAPIWAIAEAAIKERPTRALILIAAARELDSLYMIPALCRLALFPRVMIIPTVLAGQTVTTAVRRGQPTTYLPPLSSADVVYAAGGSGIVRAVEQIAQAAGAACFTDPFLPAADENPGNTLFSRTAQWLVPTAPEPPPTAPEPPPMSIIVGR